MKSASIPSGSDRLFVPSPDIISFIKSQPSSCRGSHRRLGTVLLLQLRLKRTCLRLGYQLDFFFMGQQYLASCDHGYAWFLVQNEILLVQFSRRHDYVRHILKVL